MDNDVIELREAVVDEVETLLDRFEESIGNETPYIRSNLMRARDQIQNEGEFLYNIQLALQQMQSYSGSVRNDAGHNSVMARVDELSESIQAKAQETPR